MSKRATLTIIFGLGAILAAGIALSAALGGCSINVNVNGSLFGGDKPLKELSLDGDKNAAKKIVMIPVEGVITSFDSRSLLGGSPNTVDTVRRQLDMARKDSSVAAVLLRVNSPGGGVTASDTIYHELKRFKKEKEVPVVAFFQDVAASGGYYISMCADHVLAQPTCITGSIGVLSVYVNLEGLMKEIGVGAQVVRSGKMKGTGLPFAPLNDEELAYHQTIIDDFHGKFLDVVSDNRVRVERARLAGLADGRVYVADKALEYGLVDSIGYLDAALAKARELCGSDSAQLVTYTTAASDPNYTVYSQAASGGATPPLVKMADQLGLIGEGPRFLYLWTPE